MQRGVDVLVVDHQQAVGIRRVREGEEVHAVMVVAGLLELVLPGLAGVAAPGRRIGQHPIAPGEEGTGTVALGYQHPVEVRIELLRHALEAQQAAVGHGPAGTDATAEEAEGGQGQAALEHIAPAMLHQVIQRRVAARIDRHVVVGGKGCVEGVQFLGHGEKLLDSALSARCGNGKCCARPRRPPGGRRRRAAGNGSCVRPAATGG
ncbi:hypothetical protein D9M68_814600 [compost metagenome]